MGKPEVSKNFGRQSRRDFVRVIFLASQAAAFGPSLVGKLGAAPTSSAKTGELNFLVIGDWGRGGQHNQAEVAKQMAVTAKELQPEFIVSVGDNFYDHGVTSTEDPQWQKSFERVYDAKSLQVPWYVVLGNHDYHGDCDAQIAYHKVNSRWNMPARYFSFSQPLGGKSLVDFFFLDTTPMAVAATEDKKYEAKFNASSTPKQLAWFENALAASQAPWKIAVGHHPVYSGGSHGDSPLMIKHVLPLFKKHGVQAYLHGHDHDLQHLEAENVQLFCSGAGSKLRPTKNTARTQFAQSASGFAAVSINAERMSVRLVDMEGKIMHTANLPLKTV